MGAKINWAAVWARAAEIRLPKVLIAKRLGVTTVTLRNWELRPGKAVLNPEPLALVLAWAIETEPAQILEVTP